MNRPYTAQSPYSLTPTERIGVLDEETATDGYRYGTQNNYTPGYDGDYAADYTADYEPDYEPEYDEARIDRRWMWIAGIAGAILFVAVATTGVVLGGGDSGSVSATATSGAPTTSAAPAPTSAPRAAAPMPSLPPETVTTVSPTAQAPTSTATSVPPAAAAPAEAAPPPPAPSPRTITYRVTGNRQLIDLVTIIYTDGQGALQTDVNVALPWAKTVVLDPGVELKSVTATSVAGQLNCSITDAAGTLLSAQNNNSMIATCTQ
jgi:hypothetical protein